MRSGNLSQIPSVLRTCFYKIQQFYPPKIFLLSRIFSPTIPINFIPNIQNIGILKEIDLKN